MLRNPIKMFARLYVPGSKATSAHCYVDSLIPEGAVGHVFIKAIKKDNHLHEQRYVSIAAFETACSEAGYEYEEIKQLSAREINTAPDKPVVTNHSDLAKFGSDVLLKMDDPTALAQLIFTKPFSQMNENEMLLHVEKLRTLYNLARTAALQRGITIRQQNNKIAQDESDQLDNTRHQRSPSAKRSLVDKAKKDGDKKRLAVLKMFLTMDLEEKYPGYQKMDTAQLQAAIKTETMKALG